MVGALSHSGKAVVGKALAAQEAGKRSTFVSENEQLEAGRQTRGRKSDFELGYFAVYRCHGIF